MDDLGVRLNLASWVWVGRGLEVGEVEEGRGRV